MVSKYDGRRQFISGFTGSAGTAVVTDKSAALWTDGRYYLQAEQQLDCNWIVMKAGQDRVCIQFVQSFASLRYDRIRWQNLRYNSPT